MSKNFNTNTENEETWFTPPFIIETLGEFDLDPAVPTFGFPQCLYPNGFPIKETYNENDNGLIQNWDNKRIWCNPPYGSKGFQFFEKFHKSKNVSGIFLIFCRLETKGFFNNVWDNEKTHSIFFFKSRLKFYNKEGKIQQSPNASSCLISFSEYDTNKIIESNFDGVLLYTKDKVRTGKN